MDAVAAAQRHFDEQQFAEGLRILNDECRRRRRDHVAYAQLLTQLASFYEHYAGDERRVRGYLREIRRLQLPPDNPDVVAARQTAARLDAVAARYQAEDEVLARVTTTRYEREVFEQRVAELTALIERRPDYPRLAAVYHYLGDSYLRLDQYRPAYRAFQRALELRPAIGFALPTPSRQARAFELWVRRDLSLGAWGTLGGLLLVVALLFYRARPWRRLGLRHAQVLVFLVVSWWLFFRIAVSWLGPRVTEQIASFPAPVYLDTAVGSPMSGALDTLFWYGLVGVVGAWTIAVATARFRPRWTWMCLDGTLVLVLCASLMTQFYLRHGQATFEPAEQGRYAHLRGTFYYALSQNQDPFILTDPKRYCGFQTTIRDMDEEHIRRWFERYAEVCGEP